MPAFAEHEKIHGLLGRLHAGEDVAVVTDAGSPAISDPGEKLVAEASASNIQVIPIPGPSALIAALSASGLPTSRFHFLGFLPRSDTEARQMLDEVAQLRATLVLYESPRRLGETLKRLLLVLGPRRACVARELTKLYEEFVRGDLSELASRFDHDEPQGEIVIVVEGSALQSRWEQADVERAISSSLERGEKLKTLSTELARRSGWSSQDLYRIGLGLKPKR